MPVLLSRWRTEKRHSTEDCAVGEVVTQKKTPRRINAAGRLQARGAGARAQRARLQIASRPRGAGARAQRARLQIAAGEACLLWILHIDRMADDAAQDAPGRGANDRALELVSARRRAEYRARGRADDGITLRIPNRLRWLP